MPKIVDHAQYRKELLSKSFDLFAEKGYASVTMRQIAQQLGVSTGTLYHYFPSKEALFEQLVEEMVDQDFLRAAIELENAHTLTERIEAAFNFLSKNQDYFFKQTSIFMDFCQQQRREGKEYSDALKRSEERLCQLTAELLDLQDPDVIDFVLSLIDGLILGQMYSKTANFSTQAKLLAQMLTTYLEQTQSYRGRK